MKHFDAVGIATHDIERDNLFCEALGFSGVLVDVKPEEHWNEHYATLLMPKVPENALSSLINASHSVVLTKDDPNLVLLAMSLETPIIVMEDDKENRDLIEQSHAGWVVPRDPRVIRDIIILHIKGGNGWKAQNAYNFYSMYDPRD